MEIVSIRDHKEMARQAARWFSSKWDVPVEAYEESMEECIKKGKDQAVPQWYITLENGKITGGIGVIENDYHDRKDLTPNICALYVEEGYRCRGIAGRMLDFAAADMKSFGIDKLYLITNHTSFYERYDWNFLCMVQPDGEPEMIRMYVKRLIT